MYLLFRVLLFTVLLSNEIWIGKSNSTEIEAFEISQIMPNITMEGTIADYDTSIIRVYYLNDLTVYWLPYDFYFEQDSVADLKKELRSHFFSYKKGEKYGYDYNVHRSPEKLKLPVDSMLNETWIVRNDLYGMFRNGKSFLIGSTSLGDSLEKSYSIFEFNDPKPIAYCQLRYSKSLPQINVSICKELDSIQAMKLNYMEFYADSAYMRKKGIVKGSYRSEYRLKKIDVENKNEIMRYFESL